MKRGLDVPIPVIVLCFVFGAWPIGVILAILKSVNSEYKKQQKQTRPNIDFRNAYQNWWTNTSSGAAGSNGTGTTYGNTANVNTAGTTDRKTSGEAEGLNGTTYHYSYVKKDNTAGTTGETQSTSVPQGIGTVSNTPKPTYIPQVNGTASRYTPPAATVPQTRVKGFKRSAATVLSTIFMFISLAFSVAFFLNAVDNVIWLGFLNSIEDVASVMISSSITAILYLFRQFYKSRDYRIISYLSALHGERYYSIPRLADMTNVSTARVIKDLQYMQSKGLLPNESIIDRGLGYLILYKSARAEAEADSLNIKKPEPQQQSKPKTAEEIKAEMTEHEKILHRIRELNDDIDDETVSEKIDEIEALTRKIFKLVEEKPEMEGQLDMFLSYYLPTTLKLLNSYAYFEEQGIRGENINRGMQNIEETLDMLIDGYKTQLDKLFESDTLDVTTDINVLEQMMKADGFTRTNDFGGSTATATMPDEKTEAE